MISMTSYTRRKSGGISMALELLRRGLPSKPLAYIFQRNIGSSEFLLEIWAFSEVALVL